MSRQAGRKHHNLFETLSCTSKVVQFNVRLRQSGESHHKWLDRALRVPLDEHQGMLEVALRRTGTPEAAEHAPPFVQELSEINVPQTPGWNHAKNCKRFVRPPSIGCCPTEGHQAAENCWSRQVNPRGGEEGRSVIQLKANRAALASIVLEQLSKAPSVDLS
jgi:hypothetical protein